MRGCLVRRLVVWVGTTVGCLALWGSTALAVPPTNDNFANAEVLGPSLPIELSATNVEATKEEGEPYHGTLGSKGHSIWFKWVATFTDLVTVGTCGSDFATATSIYTGTAVSELTKVEGVGEGPGCPSFKGRQITFKAVSGTTYDIAVDGDSYYVPPAEPPLGEGSIELQLEATPTPSNDDFADAQALTGSIEEEGTEAYYLASARGFNWNATKEVGEPEHAGDPGGASVWYSWTAPVSGSANAGTCEGKPLVVGAYTGDSITTLTPVGSQEYLCQATFSAVAGTTYWIAIDGEFDSSSGAPAQRSFLVHVSMQLPPQSHPKSSPSELATPSPATDVIPPDTAISKRLVSTVKRRAAFSFRSSAPGSTFRCKLDGHSFATCRSPQVYKHLKPGRHIFKVAAIDAAGNCDPWPAEAQFTIPKPKHGHSRHRRQGRS